MLLCRRHHRAVHEGGYRVDRRGRFFSPLGQEIVPVPRLPRGHPSGVEGGHRADIDERTCESGTGERLDLGYVVDALLCALAPATSS